MPNSKTDSTPDRQLAAWSCRYISVSFATLTVTCIFIINNHIGMEFEKNYIFTCNFFNRLVQY